MFLGSNAQPVVHFEDRGVGLWWRHMKKDRGLAEVSLWATCLSHSVKKILIGAAIVVSDPVVTEQCSSMAGLN